MTRSEYRMQAIRGFTIVFTIFACAFLWLAVLSFDPIDWPSPHVYPNPDPSNNAAGRAGAWVAYHLFVYFGKGVYAAVIGLTLSIVVMARRGHLPNLWQRILGVGLLVFVVSTVAHQLTESQTAAWPEQRGGVLGYAAATWMQTNVNWMMLPILAYCLVVGLLFTAEELVLRLPRLVLRQSEQSGPARSGAQATGRGSKSSASAVPGRLAARLEPLLNPIRRAITSLVSLKPALAGATVGSGKAELRVKPARKRPEPVEEEDELEESPRSSKKRAAAFDDEDEEEDLDEEYESEDDEDEDEYYDEEEEDWEEEEEEEYDEDEDEGEEDIADEADEAAEDEEDDAEPVAPQPKMVVNFAAPPKPAAAVPVIPPKPYPTELAEWEFPPISMLKEPEYNFNAQQEAVVREKARILEQALQEYRVEANVVEIDTGPVITMFEVQVAAGVKVSQIMSLANDIARALKAPSVRVVAPIPGKSTIGIEVPNLDKEVVRIRELATLAAQQVQKMALPLFLGKDAQGRALVEDLARMPHMLIAGTTGSGKSVCINSIIMSLLLTQRPDMVKLILVDPKMVEMSMFREVPHLMCPIVTEMERAEKILEWATVKMDERYALLAEAGVRNIAAYNRLTKEEKYERFQPSNDEEKAQIPLHLPYIVIIIDELADMMMLSAKEVELHLSRLAQKSRAVGIHIIVATQRPEAKIVTGLIKSNLPCRVAFRVASRMDSRIVLDQNGAEVLMGQGDMLYLPPGSAKLVRAQGTFLDDSELKAVINFLKERGEPEFHPELIKLGKTEVSGDGPQDELFDQAVDIVLETRRGSVSLLQRRLTIGYSRASRLIDEMAAVGIVGPYKGSQAREVVWTKEDWEAYKASREARLNAEVERIREQALTDGVDDDMFDDDID
ncbi:MAG TPA: DNA translocase FtsK 4TM domain-containing protein [Phycisphaerae bacterium]|nr:DNA translocase FtsK 4TM domain-containing protein [Phycisphaerae bacterium]HOJ74007.1 DNA translocase FtsK 4TM domain-containing protein [Phycisphaerae bacterium]HOM50602.1 DNA translocase FtsK 4TM domain-containing protein [Phycisphaerae bacterium]HON65111.1 DNA translocase FtsK 4TM domain-containing protein [Phycisphaerae bacterium]HOQ87100.1 DNA translocase FtsK 4TM domain-containing protein [Phycisphaerae bacterium]